MDTCTAEFERLARDVGGIDCAHAGLITFQNPFALDSWTMTLIEFVLVAGAIAGLVHAIRWKRRRGDATNLVVWLASIGALLLVEPITYFPQWFGLDDEIGLTFIHNQFSVQFLFNRLPIYIVAMYPAFSYLAFLIVRRAGIVDRERPVVAAATIAFVFLALFEVIDQVGPQWRWWIWNYRVPSGTPTLGVVPYASLAGFSLGIPFAIAFLAIVLCRRRAGVVVNLLITSVAAWPVMMVATLPAVLLDLVGASRADARIIGTWIVIAAAAAATVWSFARALRRVDGGESEPAPRDPFVVVASVVYLSTCVAVWTAAVPGYRDAVGGRTADGGYTGSFAIAAATFVLSISFVVLSELIARRSTDRMAAPITPDRAGARSSPAVGGAIT